MDELEVIGLLSEKGFSAGFAGRLIIVTTSDTADIPKVLNICRQYEDGKVSILIKFRGGGNPVYYGRMIEIANLTTRFGGSGNICWTADKKTNMEDVEDFLRAYHTR